MAKPNIHFHFLLHLALFLQIMLSQIIRLEATTPNYNPSGSQPRCVEAERKALLQFKKNLTDPSGRLSSWVGKDCCGWVGVGCSNRTGNVVKLDLGSADPDNETSKLSGKLSPSLLELNQLTYLNLSWNAMEGMIPPQLGNLSNLHYLDLSYNWHYLSGQFYNLLWVSDLNWLSGLTSLEYLNLQSVNLSKASTSWLEAISLLPTLSELHLGGCNLHYSHPLSLSIANHTSFSIIDLSSNELISEIPPWLFNITTLVELDLFGCNITGPISHLPWHNLHNLEVLNLGENSISYDVGPLIHVLPPFLSELRLVDCNLHYSHLLSLSIANHTSLSIIDLSSNSLISEIPPLLFNITTLVELDLLGCNITDPISHLPWHSLHNLEILDLGENSISDDIGTLIDALSERSNNTLHKLTIFGNHLRGQLGETLGRLTNLTSLDLTGNSISGEIPSSIGRLSFLEELDISSNNISGEIPSSIGRLSFLEVLDLTDNKISGEIPSSIGRLSFLEELDLSYNKISGEIPSSIGRLSFLEWLDLSSNKISGEIPSSIGRLSFLEVLKLSSNNMSGFIPISVGDLSSLIYLKLRDNYWTGKLSEVHFRKLSKLKRLGISSSNKALVFDVARDWIPPFSLQSIRINDCLLGPTFPPWIQTQKELEEIILSNVNISDTIPDWFWNTIKYLNLSGNEIRGELPYFLQFNSMDEEVVVDLSHNHLHGAIPLWSNVDFLYLKNNSFSGPIPMEIGKVMSSVRLLDLSMNFLNGTIPKSISKMKDLVSLDLSQNNLTGQLFDNWDTFRNLEYLHLSRNKLSGEIPMSICSSTNLYWLDLSDNGFNGGLPSSLQNCTALEGLNLGGNRLSGNLPRWSAKSLPNIGVISLRMNKLVGEIPQELCHLPKLHALDLSHNNLSGKIPTCFGNLSGLMVSTKSRSDMWDEVMDFFVKGRLFEFVKILDLVNIIDLSNNNLTGEIPEDIANLITLGTLNFSRNQLRGKIPEKIGGLRQLETLDLSHNHLSGSIPASMASLTSLSALDLSFNNLSGSIPSSTQLSTFNNSIYEGNPRLCGPPLSNPCYAPVTEASDKGKNEKGKFGNKDKDEMFWFYVSMGPGFIVGFWGLFGSLAIKRTWRIAYFKYFERVTDRLFVFVAVKINRLKRMMRRGGN